MKPLEPGNRPRRRVRLWSGLGIAVLLGVAALVWQARRERMPDYLPGDPVVRLYAADLSGTTADPVALVDAIARSGSDILILQNVGPEAFDAFESALPALRYRVSAPQTASGTGGGETLILSRYALVGREEAHQPAGSSLRTLARTPLGRVELIAIFQADTRSPPVRLQRAPGVAAVAVAWQPGVAAGSLRDQAMRPVAGAEWMRLRLPGQGLDGTTAVWRSNEIGVASHSTGPVVGGRQPPLIADLHLSRRR